MSDQQLVVNGDHVVWGDIAINLGYGSMLGAEEISWAEKQEKALRWGKGFLPTGIARGKYEASAKLKMSKDEFDGPFMDFVRAQAGDEAGPLNLKGFTVTVAYAKDDGGPAHTVRLPGCEVSNVDEAAKAGDTELSVTLDLVVLMQIVRE